MQLDNNIGTYVRTIKDYHNNRSKYTGCPQMPKYKRQPNMLIFPKQSCSIKLGYIYFDTKTSIKIP